MGRQIKRRYRGAVFVKDVDELREEFIKQKYGAARVEQFDAGAYQAFIDAYVAAHRARPRVFGGLNTMPWWHPRLYYDLHATHKYYIDVAAATLVERTCVRLLRRLASSRRDLEFLVEHNAAWIANVQRAIADECSLKATSQRAARFAASARRRGYKIMQFAKIFDRVCGALDAA